MLAMKIIGWSLGILSVVLFEAIFLGHYQPRLESTGIPMLVIKTTDAHGESDVATSGKP